ncbi:MAG: L,D-transpeptidase family protein [Steroidobacteraceae bacterium]
MARWVIVVVALGLGLAAWARWPDSRLPADVRVDHVVVLKSARLLVLYEGDTRLRSYPVSLGGQPVGAKERAGDGRTPEGHYVIDYRNERSSFHRALHVSYPSAADRSRAAAAGVDPGGLVMIHGLRNGLGWLGRLHRVFDWTNGCIAVTDAEIDEIARVVPDGTPVELRP